MTSSDPNSLKEFYLVVSKGRANAIKTTASIIKKRLKGKKLKRETCESLPIILSCLFNSS